MCDSSRVSAESSDLDSRRRRQIEQHRLRKWELLTLEGGPGLERMLLRLKERYDVLAKAPQLLEAPHSQLPEAVAFYAGLAKAPRESLFLSPKEAARVALSATDRRAEGEVMEMSFASDYEPLFPGYRDEFQQYNNNRRAYARIWRRPFGKARGTVLAIPGWYMADPRLSAIALLPGFFFSQGFNVIIYELPYTHRRMIGEGKAFPSSNLVRTNEGIFQAIFELRQIRAWLESQDETLSLVMGSSFGGYLAALWSTLDCFNAVLTVSPVADLLTTVESLFLENSSTQALPALRMAFEKIFSSVARDEIAEALFCHSPFAAASKVAEGKQAIVSAAEDAVVPQQHLEHYLTHWPSAQHCVVPGGHFAQLCTVEAQQFLRGFLAQL